jgi:hypothetical protein
MEYNRTNVCLPENFSHWEIIMTLSDDTKNPLELPLNKNEESNQTDLKDQSLEKFTSSWPKDDTKETPKDKMQWKKGDMALEYINSVKATGVNLSEADILQSLAESVREPKDSLRSYLWVSRAFPDGSIRHKGLSWSHYRAAAGSEKPIHWIEIAVNENLSVRQLNYRIARDETKEKYYRGAEMECSVCSKKISKGEFNLYQGDVPIGNFCSYGCLAAYASNAAIKKQDSGEL